MTRTATPFVAGSNQGRESGRHGGAAHPTVSILTRNTTGFLARLADLQADATRTALADATVAARELSTTNTLDRLMLVWIAQLQHGALRLMDLDGQLARSGYALQQACSDAWIGHAANWLHPFTRASLAAVTGWRGAEPT